MQPAASPLVEPALASCSEREITAEIMRRSVEEPLLVHRFGPDSDPMGGDRWPMFASTHRGVIVLFGGKGAGKTFTDGAPWAVALAEGESETQKRQYLAIMSCPPWCKQCGTGTCGKHCCPCPERGSADYRPEGCVAGQERPCPVHMPIVYPPSRSRLIIIGCLDLGRFWNHIVPVLKHFLCKTPDGKLLVDEDHQNQRLAHRDLKYVFQAAPYDDVKRAESWDPVGVWWDEFGPEQFFGPWKQRVQRSDAQMRITATAVDLVENPDQGLWVIHEIEHRKHVPAANTQSFRISAFDNVFLDPVARRRMRVEAAEELARGHEQRYRVFYLGEPIARQDASVFSRRAIERQGPHIRPGEPAWVVIPHGDTGTAMEWTVPHIVYEKPDDTVESYQLEVWHRPEATHRYALGADIAKGKVGGDYSVCEVLDMTVGEQVLEFRGQVDTTVYPAILFAVWREYRNWGIGGMVIEENFASDVISTLLFTYNVPSTDVYHRLDKQRRMLSGEPTPVAGFWTSAGSKSESATLEQARGDIPSPVKAFNDGMETCDIVIHSSILYAEVQVFVRRNGRIEALPGSHDDCVIAFSLAAYGGVYTKADEAPGTDTKQPRRVVQCIGFDENTDGDEEGAESRDFDEDLPYSA